MRWGVRDRQCGAVYRAIDFCAAQQAVNGDTERLELMVDQGHGWIPVEWLHPVLLSAAVARTPRRPTVSRRTAFYEWLGKRHTGKALRAVYGLLSRVSGRDGQPFRRHNG
jgi:hypothetical protein